MTLAELRVAVRERAGLLARDQMAQDPTLTNLINAALQWVSSRHPGGWPWLRKHDQALVTVAGVTVYPFAAIATAPDVWLKIRALRMHLGVDWQTVEATNAAMLHDAYPQTTTAMPQAWAVDGYNLLLGPAPNDIWNLRADVVVAEPALVDPTDEPLMPVTFHDSIIERVAYLEARRTNSPGPANLALQALNDTLVGMRQFARTQTGSARVTTRDDYF